jgi:hypothetical protein
MQRTTGHLRAFRRPMPEDQTIKMTKYQSFNRQD